MRFLLTCIATFFVGTAVAEDIITVEITATIDDMFDNAQSWVLLEEMDGFALGDQVKIQLTYDLDSPPNAPGSSLYYSAVSDVKLQVENHFFARTTTSGSLFSVSDATRRITLQTSTASAQGTLTSDVVFVGDTIQSDMYLAQFNINLNDADDVIFDEPGLIDISTLDISIFDDSVEDTNWLWMHFRGTPDYSDSVRVEAKITDITLVAPEPVFSGVKVEVNPLVNGEVRPLFNDLIYVVVHGTSVTAGEEIDFHPNQLNWYTVRFGPGYAQANNLPWALDVDEDGDTDAVFSFDTQATDIACGDTEVNVLGETWAGEHFESTDAITTIDCETEACHQTGG